MLFQNTRVLFLVLSTSSVDCMRSLLNIFLHFSGKNIVILKRHKNMSKKSPAWKKDVLDAQVRDWLIIGAINEDDSVEQIRSDDGDLLNRFNDEKATRNARRIAKDVDKNGSRE